MFEYTYSAKNKEGQIIRGEVEAENELSAARVLSSKSLIPIDISEKKKSGFSFFHHVSTKNKALFARQLATMINAGLPISQALDILKKQATNKVFENMLEQVARDIEGGTQLSVSLSKFQNIFQKTDLSLIASGEASGTLDKVLLRLADHLENENRINKKIRSAFAYPAFIIVVVVGVMALMIVYVMPQMESLYKSFNADLPFLTRMMIGLSHILIKFFIPLVIFLVAGVVFLRQYIQKPTGRKIWDTIKLKLPLFGDFLRKVYISRFARTLSGLVASGVPLLDSLKIVSDAVGNVVFEKIIRDAAERVKSGVPLSTPLKESSEFPIIVSQMIKVGEQTGELDSMLTNLANYFEEEVEEIVKSFSSLIEPVIIVVMALIVGTLLVAIMMPIYSLGKVLF